MQERKRLISVKNSALSVNIGIKENRSKVVSRWHYTLPHGMWVMFPESSDMCGRFGGSAVELRVF